MAASPFDAQAIRVECVSCGAPLAGAAPGAVVTCGYCNTSNQIAHRQTDTRAALSAADEIARLSRLKAQLANPMKGHAYDLDHPPPAARQLGLHEHAQADQLEAGYKQLKQLPGEANQAALCWVVLTRARQLLAQNQPDAARARLETSLGSLQDGGHRDLVRCEIALAALRFGDVAAAERWLAECNQAPEVVELDSPLRYVRALIALKKGDPGSAVTLVGNAGDMPVDNSWVAHFTLVRAHCAELRGEHGAAKFLVEKLAQDTAQMIEIADRDGLARNTAHAHARSADEAKLAECEQQLGRLISLRSSFMRFLGASTIFALPISLLFMVVGCSTEQGPFFGATSNAVCARVCNGCTGPYTMTFWSWTGSSEGSDHVVLCDAPGSPAAKMSWSAQTKAAEENHPQVLPGGNWTLWGIAYLVSIPLGLALALAARLRLAPKRKALVHKYQTEGRELATRLGREMQPRAPPTWTPLIVFLLPAATSVGLIAINLALR